MEKFDAAFCFLLRIKKVLRFLLLHVRRLSSCFFFHFNKIINHIRDLIFLKMQSSFFKNAKSVTFQTMTIPNHYMWMYRDKTILYMVKLTLRLSCAMNFAIYPHDTQECKLQMESCKYMWELAKCMLCWWWWLKCFKNWYVCTFHGIDWAAPL